MTGIMAAYIIFKTMKGAANGQQIIARELIGSVEF